MSSVPFLIFLASAVVIALVFFTVARSTGRAADVDYARANRLRGLFFLSLLVILGIFLALTLPQLPYPVEAAVPDRVVHVVGKQFAFSLTDGPGPQSLDVWDRDFSPEVAVSPGVIVEFRVTTLDTTHGFGIYTPDGRLLAQTQAMPGYVNRLRVRFEEPGMYAVHCLELCGLSHHAMKGVIQVGGEVQR